MNWSNRAMDARFPRTVAARKPLPHSGECSSTPTQPHRFTMIEVLAALVLIAIVVPVAVRGLQIANRVGVAAERSETAARLGSNLLRELVGEETWMEADESGDFGEDWPHYRWDLKDEEWGEDESLRLLTLTVFYEVQGREYNVELSVLAAADEVEEQL